MRRSLLLAPVLLSLLAPAAAHAGNVAGSAGSYSFIDAAAETNTLTIIRSGLTITFTDTSTAVTESSGDCSASAGVVTCTAPGGASDFVFLNVTMGGGNDKADAGGANGNTSFTALGGAGNDELIGNALGNLLVGDADNDTLTGNGGFDSLTGAAGADTLNGGADGDSISGGDDVDTIDGGDGNDQVNGGAGADILEGGAQEPDGFCGDTLSLSEQTGDLNVSLDGVANDATGDGDSFAGFESVDGGSGNDTLRGNDGENCLDGNEGRDLLEGFGGRDDLESGGAGPDTLDGGAGDDDLEGEPSGSPIVGGDVFIGGDGVDELEVTSTSCDGGGTCQGRTVTVSLDGQVNDGQDGENDDVRLDIEDLVLSDGAVSPGQPEGQVTFIGDDDFNVLRTDAGDDTIEPRGGSDDVHTFSGDDVVRARDGFADRIDCGRGTDTAEVDQLDIVVECEVVNRETTPVALEDRPPTVTFAPPGSIDPRAPTTLRADAADDRGVQRVLFMDDDRTICNDDAAPFECSYQPRGEDVGRNTLIAIAIDTGEQGAFASRAATVAKFVPTRLTIGARGGRLVLPAGLSPALGCRGKVTVRIRRGRRVIATRRVKLSRTCRYRVRIRVRRRARAQARFGGNAVAQARSSRSLRA